MSQSRGFLTEIELISNEISDDIFPTGTGNPIPNQTLRIPSKGVLHNFSPKYPSVGCLIFNYKNKSQNKNSRYGIATGTLIGPTTFLTAGHCFVANPEKDPSDPRHPDNWENPTDKKHWTVYFEDFGEAVCVEDVILHSSFDKKTTQDIESEHGESIKMPIALLAKSTADFAILKLSFGSFPNTIPSLMINTETDNSKYPTMEANLIGYGENSYSETFGMKRIGRIDLDKNCDSNNAPNNSLCFTIPDNADDRIIDTCKGDSGGPLLSTRRINDRDVNVVLGTIVGGEAENCVPSNNKKSWTTDIAQYKAFIRKIIDNDQPVTSKYPTIKGWNTRKAYGYLDIDDERVLVFEIAKDTSYLYIALNGEVMNKKIIEDVAHSKINYRAKGDPEFQLTIRRPGNNEIYTYPEFKEGKVEYNDLSKENFLWCRIKNPKDGNWGIKIKVINITNPKKYDEPGLRDPALYLANIAWI